MGLGLILSIFARGKTMLSKNLNLALLCPTLTLLLSNPVQTLNYMAERC